MGKKTNQSPKTKNKGKTSVPKQLPFLAQKTWVLGIIIVSVFALYGNTLNHGFVLDDGHLFQGNRFVQAGFKGIPDIFSNGFLKGSIGTNDQSYRPLPLTSFAIERALFNNNPSGSHFVSILLYALCGIFIWLAMKEMLAKKHYLIPLFITLVFVAHPVHTEVVANIKGRDELLHFLFVISALWAALKYVKFKQFSYLIISVILFFLGLLSKEMTVTFIVLIPLTLWFFTKASAKELGPIIGLYAAALGLYFAIRFAVLDAGTFEESMSPLNNALAGAEGKAGQLASAIFMLLLYVKLLFLPHPLSYDYSANQIPLTTFSSWQTWLAIAVFLGLLIVVIKGFKNKSPFAWGILFFFISISIVSNIGILIGATMAERFLFTPSLGFAVILVFLIAKILRLDTEDKTALESKKFTYPIAVILALFNVKTITRNGDWKSNETLFESGIETAPNSTRTWSALASVYRVKAETAANPAIRNEALKKAIEYYKKSLSILEDNFDSWYNLGVCYNMMNQPKKGLKAFRKTVAINSKYENAWNNIGVYYSNTNQLDSAKANFEKLLAINSKNPDGLCNLAVCFHQQGDLDEAKKWYLKALEIAPNHANAQKNLNLLLKTESEKNLQQNAKQQP